MNAENESILEPGIKGLPESIVSAMAGYVDPSNSELQADLKRTGYQSFTPKDTEFDQDTFLESLKEANDNTDLPPIINVGNKWFTRNINMVDELTKYHLENKKELLEQISQEAKQN